ncbi:MAG TPA: hypothetical protein VMT15_00935 [Bryobacteraceae bacterium]|nr:hypothetical protein [Bryobacteraceae bacterium]
MGTSGDTFLVRAVNTATDSENQIHDDKVAAEYGFRGGLVPGVTVYGYMASALLNFVGPRWLDRGAMDVRFFEPFYEGEQVLVSVSEEGEGRWQARAGSRASAMAWIESSAPTAEDIPERASPERLPASRDTIRRGFVLGSFEKHLDLSTPGVSAPLDAFIGDERVAHPAIVLALANEILMRNFVLGPWIHASSEIRNASAICDGEGVTVHGRIVDAFERKGHEFVVLDVAIWASGRLASRIRHTAIWQLAK